MIRFRAPNPNPLAGLPAWVSIVEIIGHEPYGTGASMLQCVWKIARVRHMMVPQIEPDNPRTTTKNVSRQETSCATRFPGNHIFPAKETHKSSCTTSSPSMNFPKSIIGSCAMKLLAGVLLRTSVSFCFDTQRSFCAHSAARPRVCDP